MAVGVALDENGNPFTSLGGIPLTVNDNSDSGNDPNSDNPIAPGDMGTPDDPTPVQIPTINLAKSQSNVTTPAMSGTVGNADVTFTLVIENTGNTNLNNINLEDNLATQLASAFVTTIGTPDIIASTATTNPSINNGYDGDNDISILDGMSGWQCLRCNR